MQKLLLLHGALGCQRDFDALRALLSKTYECYTFDFIGHGTQAQQKTALSIPAFADQTKHFIVQNNLQNALVFGYSMGGYVATYLHKHTGYFSKIYTLGTKFIWQPESAQQEASMLNPKAIAEKAPTYAAHLINKHGAPFWEALLQKTAEMMLGLGQNPALTLSDFKDVACPIAIGLGDRDKMIPLTDAVAIKNQLPNACLDILPYTQHPIDRVKTDLLAARLKYFFDL
ncbi:MAG: alpha/beta fold hydrolase [Sphingobacteriaceae bacterium]|nr:alpha/beta fold hydrolase [Sphingobacteriaceae bacterium]